MRAALALLFLVLGNAALAQAAPASPAPETDANTADAATPFSPIPYWELEDQPNAIPGFPDNKTTLIVCTSPWTPAVYCQNDTDPLTWTGFEIETFRLVATRMGLRDSQIDMRCYDKKDTGWDDMLQDSYDSKCDITVAGLGAREDRIEKGLRFSVPSLRSGFGIMVSRETEPPGMWYFFSAMAWEVWVLMIVTGIAIGVIVWLFEVGMRALNTDTRHMSNVMWDTLGRPVQMRDYRLSSIPANLTAVMWSFLVFILMVIYSANLTANLTITQIKNDIKGLADLPGKAVGSWEGFADDLKKFNIAITSYPWNGPEDEVAMINALKAGFIRALVFDNNLLEIYDATDCQTMLVGDEFYLQDATVGFAPNTWQNHPGFVDQYDIAMLYVVQGTGGVDELVKRFIKVQQAPCKSSTVGEGYSSVTLTEVSGLWVILAVSVGVGLLIVICYRLWESKMKPYAHKKGWLSRTDRMLQHYATLKTMGWKKDDSMVARYMGSSNGYIDGSSDAVPNLPRADSQGFPPGYQYRHNRVLLRSDTAQDRDREAREAAGHHVDGHANGHATHPAAPSAATPANMDRVLHELASLRQLVMSHMPPASSTGTLSPRTMERTLTAHALGHTPEDDDGSQA